MATSVNLNGATYSVPAVGEPRGTWGSALSSYLIALSTGTLQRNGGNQALSADLNTGSFGFVVPYIKSSGSNIATTGQVRLANNESIVWRNATNGADITLKVNGANALEYNGVALSDAASAVTLTGAQTVSNKTLTAVAGLTLNSGVGIDWAAGSTSIGASIGINTLTVGGAGTSVYVPGIVKSGILTTNDDKLYINNDAVGSGADFKAIIQRPTTGMAADATLTLPVTTDTLVGRATTDTLTNKTLTSPTINTPTVTSPSVATPTFTTAVTLTNVATPSTPSAGLVKVYSKTDNKVYKLTSAGLETEIGSGGGLAGVAKTSNYTAAANEMVEGDATAGSFTVTFPTIPAGGAVIGVMDAAENASATNFIRVSAPQALGTLPVGDSLLIDYARGSLIAYAAPGATSWKVQYQATSMISPGLQTGYTGGSAIGAGYIGEMLGTARSGTGGFSSSFRSNTALTNANQTLLTATLNKGVYLVGYSLDSAWSLDGYVLAHAFKVGGTGVNYGSNQPSKAGLQASCSIGPMPLQITADGTVVTVEGSWSGGIGTSTGNFHEMWIIRIA